MKDEILDKINDETYPKYAIKSFNQFLYSIAILIGFLVFFLFFGNSVLGGSPNGLGLIYLYSLIPLLLILSALTSSILGVQNAMKSQRKKERVHWKKYVGAIGNFILVMLLVLLMFILGMDIYNVFIK